MRDETLTEQPVRWSSRIEGWAIGLTCLAITILYLTILQTDVSGSHSDYTLDTGEFQNALNLWGTLHHTGYPLYSLLGSPFVWLARALGATPAASASLFSLLWSIASLPFIILLGREIGGRVLYGIAGALLLAATHSFWVHSVIAEVYSQTLFLTVLAIWLTLRCGERPQWLPWLGVVLGFAVGLHRSALLVAPASIVYLLAQPAMRRALSLSLVLKSALAFIATFAVYLYLPLRVASGASWHFGRPDSWEGFLDIFFARQVRELMVPERNPEALWANLRLALELVRAELTTVGLVAGVSGLLLGMMARPTRWHALMLLLIWAAFILFAALFPRAVFLPAVLLQSLLASALGLSLLLRQIEKLSPRLALLSSVAAIVCAALLMVQSRPAVAAYSQHPGGRVLLDSVAQLEEPGPVLAAPWGTDYFTLAYGQEVSGEVGHARLNRPEDNFEEWLGRWLTEGETVYLPKDILYAASRAEWESQWGRLCLSSGGWGLLAIRRAPCGEAMAGEPIALYADSIALLASDVKVDWERREVALRLEWQSLNIPATDYSVFVHLTDKPVIMGAEDIIAQGDSAHPVYGWSPTSTWERGQIVRDDYRVSWPEGRTPDKLVVGMYYQDPATGAFNNVGAHTIPLR